MHDRAPFQCSLWAGPGVIDRVQGMLCIGLCVHMVPGRPLGSYRREAASHTAAFKSYPGSQG